MSIGCLKYSKEEEEGGPDHSGLQNELRVEELGEEVEGPVPEHGVVLEHPLHQGRLLGTSIKTGLVDVKVPSMQVMKG